MGYAVYTPLIKSKLEALEESDDSALLSQVDYGHNPDGFNGFPAVEFARKKGSEERTSTHQNEETCTYKIYLIHEYKRTDKSHAEIMADTDEVVDAIRSAFRTDPNLGGNCMSCDLIEDNYYDIILEEPFIFAEFTLVIKDFVNRN